MLRLQKYLADCGVTSRRKAEELILNAEIKVNDRIVTELGTKIEPGRDRVFYQDKEILPPDAKVYIMLNKPEGYVTTAKDQFGRPTVIDLLKNINERLFPVGRLDYNTSGLLILTNDGELAYRLTHPKHEAEKVYIATVKGRPTEEELVSFRRGLMIDGKITAEAGIKILRREKVQAEERKAGKKTTEERALTGEISLAEITIHEGRNRQVRKMCAAIGHEVIKLERVSVGELRLEGLPKGQYKHLTDEEVERLTK